MSHQFLIASYQKDFVWLVHCLRKLSIHMKGFLPPVVVVDEADKAEAATVIARAGSDAILRVRNGVGFGRAQCVMLEGDLHCPDADYVWLLGSDCMAVRDFTPADWCDERGRPLMLWRSWEFIRTRSPRAIFWRTGVEAALQRESIGEFMVRIPIGYPRALFPAVRNELTRLHGDWEAYVMHNVNLVKNFSESNILGEVAYREFYFQFAWFKLDDYQPLPVWLFIPPIRQLWSHGGVEKPKEAGVVSPDCETLSSVVLDEDLRS